MTVGVDLAAEPTRTALASIHWEAGTARLTHLQLGIRDAEIVEKSKDATAIGIDCAFGWPIEFVDFVTAHANRTKNVRAHSGIDLRRRLAYRHTDRAVREQTGRWPLSVSTDRLGMTAIHCAELLGTFADAGEHVDRSGAGRRAPRRGVPRGGAAHLGSTHSRVQNRPRGAHPGRRCGPACASAPPNHARAARAPRQVR